MEVSRLGQVLWLGLASEGSKKASLTPPLCQAAPELLRNRGTREPSWIWGVSQNFHTQWQCVCGEQVIGLSVCYSCGPCGCPHASKDQDVGMCPVHGESKLAGWHYQVSWGSWCDGVASTPKDKVHAGMREFKKAFGAMRVPGGVGAWPPTCSYLPSPLEEGATVDPTFLELFLGSPLPAAAHREHKPRCVCPRCVRPHFGVTQM